MKNIKHNSTKLVNALIEINNERIEGYETAISLLPNEEAFGIRQTFENLKNQSLGFKNQLAPLVVQAGDEPTERSGISGKLFRTWMSVTSALSTHTTASILENCQRGEEKFAETYRRAIEGSTGAPLHIVEMIQQQSDMQQESKEEINRLINSRPSS